MRPVQCLPYRVCRPAAPRRAEREDGLRNPNLWGIDLNGPEARGLSRARAGESSLLLPSDARRFYGEGVHMLVHHAFGEVLLGSLLFLIW